MESLSPILRRKLRNYRTAYFFVALAEALCIAALLAALLNPHYAPWALLWLGFRFFIRPTPQQIVELVAKRNRQRIPSLKLVVTLIVAAVGVNVGLELRRRATLESIATAKPARPAPSARVEPPAKSPAPPPVDPWLVQLRSFADQLDAQAGDVKRELPAAAKTLKAALEAAEQAVAAANAGDRAQARVWQQAVSDRLTEFAQEAKQSSELSGFAELANALATAYAEAASRTSTPTRATEPSDSEMLNNSTAPRTKLTIPKLVS